MYYDYKNENNHKPNCRHCDTDFFLEAHSGGTATCMSGPICEKCGHEYGSPDPDAHDWGFDRFGLTWSQAAGYTGATAYFKCVNGCGQWTYPHAEFSTRTEGLTCETDGYIIYTATISAANSPDHTEHMTEERVATAALGHNWDTAWSYDENGHYHKCLNDGCTAKNDEAAHSGGAATCVSGPVCDTCKQEYDSAPGHDLKAVPKEEATCAAPGTEAYWVCQRQGCGKKFSDAEGKNVIQEPVSIAINKSNHAGPIVDVAGKTATCAETGLTDGKQCSACKAFTVKQKTIPKDKNNHAGPIVGVAGKAATCAETGLTNGKQCSACKVFTVEQETIPKDENNHAGPIVGVAGKTPTCTDTGLTEGKHCSVCGTVLEKQETIPATGHHYTVSDASITRVYYRCSECGDSYWADNPFSGNVIPGLVRDEHGENINYTAGISIEKGKRILTVTPDFPEGDAKAASLWLKTGICGTMDQARRHCFEVPEGWRGSGNRTGGNHTRLVYAGFGSRHNQLLRVHPRSRGGRHAGRSERRA